MPKVDEMDEIAAIVSSYDPNDRGGPSAYSVLREILALPKVKNAVAKHREAATKAEPPGATNV